MVKRPMGIRMIGRPKIRWMDDVCNDIKVMNINNWKELALNRKVRMTWLRKQKSS
jgi:hypothetical protein